MLALLAFVPAVLAVPNYFHFVKNGDEANYDSRQVVADGVSLFKWNGTVDGISDMGNDICAHNVIEWEAGSISSFPPASVWHQYDTTYFVARGSVSITVDGVSKTMKKGDTVWIQAGLSHSSLVPVDNDEGIIIDALKTPFDPQSSQSPSQKGEHRFYMASEELTPPTTFQGPNDHYEWYSTGSSDPDVLHVWWKPSAAMNCHSHNEGALYVAGSGKMCFAGERNDDSCLLAGDARWTKPRYQYSNEAAGSEGAEIIVLNIQSNPSRCQAMV